MELKCRKPTRLKEFDYSSNGVYFITICSKDKKPIFSKIVGEGLCALPKTKTSSHDIVGEGLCALPKTKLSNIGLQIKDAIEFINTQYEHISVDNYVIMPNHIHMLVRYESSVGGHRDPPLQDIIARFKSFTTHQYGKPMWQRSFHDHIIRNEQDYIEHYTYIENNPAKWAQDELYTEY